MMFRDLPRKRNYFFALLPFSVSSRKAKLMLGSGVCFQNFNFPPKYCLNTCRYSSRAPRVVDYTREYPFRSKKCHWQFVTVTLLPLVIVSGHCRHHHRRCRRCCANCDCGGAAISWRAGAQIGGGDEDKFQKAIYCSTWNRNMSKRRHVVTDSALAG